jgi:hypothetical protein
MFTSLKYQLIALRIEIEGRLKCGWHVLIGKPTLFRMDFYHGIKLKNVHHVLIRGCTFSPENQDAAITVDPSASHCVIEHCSMTSASVAVAHGVTS